MKSIYSLFCLIAAISLSPLLGGCINEDDSIQEITYEQLPEAARSFLTYYFPGQSPTKIEKGDALDVEGVYPYKVSLPDGFTIAFDATGDWQQFCTFNKPLSAQLNKFFPGIEAFVEENLPNDCISQLTKTNYGLRVGLQGGQWLAFRSCHVDDFMGYEIDMRTNADIPAAIKNFIFTHFPEVDYELVIRTMPSATDELTYKITLENQFRLFFDANAQWSRIEGGEQLLPASIIQALPEKVQTMLTKDYPDAKISSLEVSGTRYQIRVSENMTVLFDTEQKPIVVPYGKVRAFAESIFGPIRSMSIGHALHQEVLTFTACFPNGFNIDTDETGEQWLKIDGHGLPFPPTVNVLPAGIADYVASHSDAAITSAAHASYGYLIALTNGAGLRFDWSGAYLGAEQIVLTPYEKTYAYVRSHYPEEYTISFYSWSATGWTYRLKSGVELKFDPAGNLI